ncbi:hypothetical protein [Roseateles saccharophilus]|uniref:Uncharacterized protein n=1 Tax=Roseateles saccharophilus TaxID=304 RepID=A0A4R3UU10_ROSSA|nr:hypothetical protein [Roseateles saccharophilus]MDG0833220.1 hypothetical protein [Roseateles saccharophilus]TCU94431.1 hypothetical protein EV671_101776 [Roseateles saccharophilus]
MADISTTGHGTGFLLCFSPIRGDPPLEFPCDSQGHVDLDALNDHDRTEYLAARALIGHSFLCPLVSAGMLIATR